MKKSKIIFFSIMLLTLLISFTIAQEIQSTKGIGISQVVENDIVKSTTYTFTEAGDSLGIGGHNYWNIQPSSDTNPAFIKVNDKNEITDASFKVNEKGGQYAFGDHLVSLPANSSVFLRRGILMIDQPPGTNISSIENASFGSIGNGPSKIIYSGDNLIFPSGDKLNKGSIEYSNGNFYVSNTPHPSDEVVINSVHFSNIKSPIPVYFGGDGTKRGVSFNGGSTVLNFQNENFYHDVVPHIDFEITGGIFRVEPMNRVFFNFDSKAGPIPQASVYSPSFQAYCFFQVNGQDYQATNWQSIGGHLSVGGSLFSALTTPLPTVSNRPVLTLFVSPDKSSKQPYSGTKTVFDQSGGIIDDHMYISDKPFFAPPK